MTKKLVYFGIIMSMVSGCASLSSTATRYDYDLARDNKSSDANGEVKILELQQNRLAFEFFNKSKSTSKIIWDETVVVDVNGKPQRILHDGVKYADASNSQPSSIVLAGGSLKDSVTFAEGVDFSAYGSGGMWTEGMIVPCSSPGQLCKPDEFYGKSLTLLLTVENSGKKSEYTTKLVLKKKESK